MPPILRTTTVADLACLIGEELGPSEWFTLTQARVNDFAQATNDFQWIHVDVERATRSNGGTIAHGYLTLSLIPILAKALLCVVDAKRTLNYGSDKVRFPEVVRVGKRIRLRQTVQAVESKAGGVLLTRNSVIEVEGEAKPACIATTLSLVFGD
jgi:acyl dehydratase